MLEHRDGASGHHYRAFKKTKHKVFEDGVKLCFSGGEIPLNSNEWMTTQDIEKAFLGFLIGESNFVDIEWRDITNIFA